MAQIPDMDIVSVCFGFSVGFFVLTMSKAAQQTFAIYQRTRRLLNLYAWMIWTEGIVNFIMAVVSWLYLRGNVKGSYVLFQYWVYKQD